MTSEDISVVIPVYDGAFHLAETIETALAQTLAPRAIIVVDDGSEDATPQVAARFGEAIRYVRQPHGGAARARNLGTQCVETEYLAFLDGDDLWAPNKLEKQLAELRDAEPPAMIFGHTIQFASPELRLDEISRLNFDPSPVPGICASGLFMGARDFRAVGPFDERLRTGEFIEWYARAAAKGIAARVLPDVVFRRRLHRGNHGLRQTGLRLDYARAMKAVLDRRRERS